MLGSYTDSIVRAMISTCVPKEELGKVYSMIATTEASVPLFLPQIYATVFSVSIVEHQQKSCCHLLPRLQKKPVDFDDELKIGDVRYGNLTKITIKVQLF